SQIARQIPHNVPTPTQGVSRILCRRRIFPHSPATLSHHVRLKGEGTPPPSPVPYQRLDRNLGTSLSLLRRADRLDPCIGADGKSPAEFGNSLLLFLSGLGGTDFP